MSQNPLLIPFATPHEVPPFDTITLAHYAPAFEQAITQMRESVDRIVSNEEVPTFSNTIEALEFSGDLLDQISNIFFNLNEADTSDAMQELALELSPKLTTLNNDVMLNAALFDRVRRVWEAYQGSCDTTQAGVATGSATPATPLNTEQSRLLEKTYKVFARLGAALSADDQVTYRTLSERLSELSLRFNQNLLSATNAYTLHLTHEEQLAGLPEFVRDGAAAEARERGLTGWVITLQAPSMVPFMTYSPNRTLKEQLWRAYNARAYRGEWDNTLIVLQIVETRLELARLLGYKTWADYVLEERMAENAPTVNRFLDDLLEKGQRAAQADVAAVAAYAREQGADFELMPWDFGYFSEQLKQERYTLNDELTKPYFQLEKAERGIFALAEKLYGLTFRQSTQIPVYQSDVRAFEVFDAEGKFLSVLYMDYFPRASKRGGAWMTEFRPQSIANGNESRPLISVVCNFTKPTENAPSLLTFNEVSTLLHEFGHALHGMLARGSYPSLSGTSVYRDFVELPSQIMENWATEPEFLQLWATHYQSGEPIPTDLINRIVEAKNFLAGYGHLRQLSFGMADMAWHSLESPITVPGDRNNPTAGATALPHPAWAEAVATFERQAMESTRVLPYVDGQCMATSFGHIFSGGYAAGYYSYKWAEVLEADAFSMFEECGVFNTEVAAAFRHEILERGGTEHPMALYVRFRGHKPDPAALFKKLGFTDTL